MNASVRSSYAYHCYEILTGNLAFFLSGDLLERSNGEIKVILMPAGRASVSNDNFDTLVVLGVRELDVSAAVRRLGVKVTVTLGLCVAS